MVLNHATPQKPSSNEGIISWVCFQGALPSELWYGSLLLDLLNFQLTNPSTECTITFKVKQLKNIDKFLIGPESGRIGSFSVKHLLSRCWEFSQATDHLLFIQTDLRKPKLWTYLVIRFQGLMRIQAFFSQKLLKCWKWNHRPWLYNW